MLRKAEQVIQFGRYLLLLALRASTASEPGRYRPGLASRAELLLSGNESHLYKGIDSRAQLVLEAVASKNGPCGPRTRTTFWWLRCRATIKQLWFRPTGEQKQEQAEQSIATIAPRQKKVLKLAVYFRCSNSTFRLAHFCEAKVSQAKGRVTKASSPKGGEPRV